MRSLLSLIAFVAACVVAFLQGIGWHAFDEFAAIEFGLVAAGLALMKVGM